MVRGRNKDREFRVIYGNSLFLFRLRRLFLVTGCVNCAALAFGLFFGWIDFAGLSPTIAALYFLNGHDAIIYGFPNKYTRFGLDSC